MGVVHVQMIPYPSMGAIHVQMIPPLSMRAIHVQRWRGTNLKYKLDSMRCPIFNYYVITPYMLGITVGVKVNADRHIARCD